MTTTEEKINHITDHLRNLERNMSFYGLNPDYDFKLNEIIEKGEKDEFYQFEIELYHFRNDWEDWAVLGECGASSPDFKYSLEHLFYSLKKEDMEKIISKQLEKVDALLIDFIKCGYDDIGRATQRYNERSPFKTNTLPDLSWNKRFRLRCDFTDLLMSTRNELVQYSDRQLQGFKAIDPVLQNVECTTAPSTPRKQIIFNDPGQLELIFEGLKIYFKDDEANLKKALQGEEIEKPLFFPHRQNKLAELFRRLDYNACLLNNKTEINKWLCKNFEFEEKGKVKPFNRYTIKDILSTGKGEAKKGERICEFEWLKYKTQATLEKEKENEKKEQLI